MHLRSAYLSQVIQNRWYQPFLSWKIEETLIKKQMKPYMSCIHLDSILKLNSLI